MNRRISEWSHSDGLIAAAAVTILGLLSAAVLGANPWASFPNGDGGLFDRICQQLLRTHFAYPHSISYNGFSVPFAYSPLAFYSVAAIASLFHVPIPTTMNLWVIGWDAVLPAAAYLAARQFLHSRFEAIVTAGFLAVYPGNLAWLGMGGAMTRAPGFFFFLIAAGAAWRSISVNANARWIVVAVVAGSLSAWMHMEFFFLYAVSLLIFTAFQAARYRRVALIGILTGVLVAPWPIVAGVDPAAYLAALSTAHSGAGGTPLSTILRYLGVTAVTSPVALIGFACSAIAFVCGRRIWFVWALILIVADSRAGLQAAHLPSALTIGWAFGWWRSAVQTSAFRFGPVVAAILLIETGSFPALADAHSFERLASTDLPAIEWLSKNTAPEDWVIPIFPGSLARLPDRDQTYEWLPAFGNLKTPITYQGLEWVGHDAYIGNLNRFAMLYSCSGKRSACLSKFIQTALPGTARVEVLVPRHGEAYELIVSSLQRDTRYREVFQNGNSAIFETGAPTSETPLERHVSGQRSGSLSDGAS